jgi:tryptophan 2,3-dioxygenase
MMANGGASRCPPQESRLAMPVYYADYLRLDTLLAAQVPESARHGTPAHDEMLFIVVHQAYELWFRQILHELDRIQADFERNPLADEHLGRIVHSLDRINEILKLLIQQLDVLETMTPLDFLDFRDLLMPASGFQSMQFRAIETRLGLKREGRLLFDERAFDDRLSAADRARLADTEKKPKLVEQLDRWLGRTPFIAMGSFAFGRAYRAAVEDMLRKDAARVRESPVLTEQQRKAEAAAIEAALEKFNAIFAPTGGESPWRMSLAAVQAALFITVYRDRPVLQLPFRLLTALMDIEEQLTLWRYRHALMVQRMIGVKIGTGGSSGHDYLHRTVEAHRVFADLFGLSTYLIPRSALPPLPPEVQSRMGFVYAKESGE